MKKPKVNNKLREFKFSRDIPGEEEDKKSKKIRMPETKKTKKKKKVPATRNPDVGPKIRVAWGQMSKDQRKAVLRVLVVLGQGAQYVIDSVKDTKSWKEGKKDLVALVHTAFADTGDDLPPGDTWLDEQSKAKSKITNGNQVFDLGGVMEVVLFSALLQVMHRTTR